MDGSPRSRPTRARSLRLGPLEVPEGHARNLYVERAGGLELTLCRVGGRLFALDRVCPHEQGRFSDGPLVEGRLVQCPLHSYRFDPRSGRCEDELCEPATVFAVRESAAGCEVELGP